MNEIKVTVELCGEDRAKLDNIIGYLSGILGYIEDERNDHIRADEAKTETEPVKEEPIKEEAHVTMEQVQAMVQKLAAPSAGFRDQVRAIVKEYADRVSQIPEDKLDEVMTRLTAITKEA